MMEYTHSELELSLGSDVPAVWSPGHGRSQRGTKGSSNIFLLDSSGMGRPQVVRGVDRKEDVSYLDKVVSVSASEQSRAMDEEWMFRQLHFLEEDGQFPS